MVVVGVDGGVGGVGDGLLRDGRAEEAQQDELSTHCGDAVFLRRGMDGVDPFCPDN